MIDKSKFTSLEISIELHKYGFYVPSMYYYEWTGATEIEELTELGWLEDSINVYTDEEMAAHFPSNVAVNESVVEFSIKPGDNEATKKAKVIVYLLKNKIIERIDATAEKVNFEYELMSDDEIRRHIRECEGRHVQQVVFSTYMDALTQICFTEQKIRSGITWKGAVSKKVK